MAFNFDIDALAQLLGASINAAPFQGVANSTGEMNVGALGPAMQNPLGQLAAQQGTTQDPMAQLGPLLAAMQQPDANNPEEQQRREAQERMQALLAQIQGSVPAPPAVPPVNPNFRGSATPFPIAGSAANAQNQLAGLFGPGLSGQAPAPGLAQLLLGAQRR